MANLYDVTAGKLKLNLHPGQSRAWQSKARIVAVIAGSQGGKTSFGPWWLNSEISRRGRGDYIAVTSSYDLFKLKMLPEIRNVFEHVLKIGRYWAGDKILELRDPVTGEFRAKTVSDPMWGRIILRSAAAGGGLESATAKAAWLDEAGQDEFSLDSWEAVRRRLTLYQGRILITTTPYSLGWLKQNIIDKSDGTYIDVITFPSITNPSFPESEFLQLKATMPEWKFKMFMEGIFTRPPGMIFGDFRNFYREDGGHKVRQFDIPSDWPRFVGVDPGSTNTAMVWLAYNKNENVYYLYRSTHDGGKSTPEHAIGAQNVAVQGKENVVNYFVGQKAEVQQRLDWIAAGVTNVKEPIFHDVEAGIDRVIQLFRQDRLFIVDECIGVLDQLGRYSRKLNDMGEPIAEIADKKSFHYLDALRYVAVGVVDPPQLTLMQTAFSGLYMPKQTHMTSKDYPREQ